MDQDVVEVILGALCTVGIAVWIFVRNIVRRVERHRATPEAALSDQYTARIREMRAAGVGYQDQLNFLLQHGMKKEIAEQMLASVERAAYE